MKILHTADWHIGKQLKKQSLNPELRLYFQWLADLLSTQHYDLLVVAGDIFDSYNPKADDRALYYETLNLLSNAVGRIIITGGNHDSIAVLNAATPILDSLNISVIGGATEDLKDELLAVESSDGDSCVIAAIPYLRDRDVLANQTFDNDRDRPSQIRAGYERHYRAVYGLAKDLYPSLPLIGMGHLYATGAKVSDSERDIQVGNQGAVEATIFEGYDYVALGHIHRPQRVSKLETVRYSGSPVALSFSEKSDRKTVVSITLGKGKVQGIESIDVPQFRELQTLSGTLSEVQDALGKYNTTCPLPTFLEVIVKEQVKDISKIPLVEQVIKEYNETSTQGKILKHTIKFDESEDNIDALFVAGTQIDELTHHEVFDELLAMRSQDKESINQLTKTYAELAENYQTYLDETA